MKCERPFFSAHSNYRCKESWDWKKSAAQAPVLLHCTKISHKSDQKMAALKNLAPPAQVEQTQPLGHARSDHSSILLPFKQSLLLFSCTRGLLSNRHLLCLSHVPCFFLRGKWTRHRTWRGGMQVFWLLIESALTAHMQACRARLRLTNPYRC